ncbi:MAG: tetratricopeptide repeat protein [Longimicrobiales bacterium]|nr:tetratricopeptide repeat protein [Longimicrobiales bacterium]
MTRRCALVAIPLLLIACSPPDDQETGSIRGDEVRQTRAELPPELVAALDSGNAAYRRGDYQAALTAYEEAVAADDDVAAGWFGIYMAHLALGNTEAADSAMERAQSLAPGASLIHPGRDTTP